MDESDPLASLRESLAAADGAMRSRWNRSLSAVEYLSDRWDRARSLGFGPESSIYNLSYVYGDVRVGEHTWIGPFTLLDGSGGLSIGSYCSISSGVQIYSHNTVRWAVSGGNAPYEYGATTIEDHCFIGPQTVVAMGVTIGKGTVVGAHAYVNKSIPPYSIAVGVPVRVVGRVVIGDDGKVELRYH